MKDAKEVGLLDAEDESGVLGTHGLGVAQAEPELDPVAEGEGEGGHDLGRDALGDEVVERDAHADHGRGAAAQLPELGEVDAEVGEGVHGEDGHVEQVGHLDASALQPLVLVRLQAPERLGVEPERAQLPPREVVLLHVLPREHEYGLAPPAEERHALVARERHRHGRAHARSRRI